MQSISMLSDDELLRRLTELLRSSRGLEAELVAHIGEVDARRLYAKKASSSMFSHCVEVLHLSEHEAYLRIAVARASRKHPVLLEMLADGRLHLSGIAKLAPYLTEANREALLARATGKSKRQIEELIAELFPQPDVPARMRKLPQRRRKDKARRAQLGPDQAPQLHANEVSRPSPAPVRPAVVEPLRPSRYKIQFTASAELHDKLERLRALMRGRLPDGDLATVIDVAVIEKLERLESKRFGKRRAPQKRLETKDTSPSSPSSRYIPAAVKRAVWDRDQGQCRFVDRTGRRCSERRGLELHHRKPFGHGGNHDPSNLELACRTHNTVFAERDYGKKVMERYRRSPSRVSEPAAVYTFSNRTTRVRRVESWAPLTGVG